MDTCLCLSSTDFTPLQASQNRWIKLDCLNFVCKGIALSELNLSCVLFTIIASFPCATASLFLHDNWQICLHNSKTLKVVLFTKFCPLCDKQVITVALGQLRINFTCIFKVFQIALIASRLGQFCENFQNTHAINP